MNRVTLRPALDSDLAVLAAIFRSAVETAGPEWYSAERVRTWAGYPLEHPEGFTKLGVKPLPLGMEDIIRTNVLLMQL